MTASFTFCAAPCQLAKTGFSQFSREKPQINIYATPLCPKVSTGAVRPIAQLPSSSQTGPATPPLFSPSSFQISDRLRKFLSRAEEGNPQLSLQKAEAGFNALKRTAEIPAPTKKLVTITETPVLQPEQPPDYDVVVAGGTLGIFYATALRKLGWRVAVIERGVVQGRKQEWNISREELSALVENGVISRVQLEEAIVTECSDPGRLAFAARDGNVRQVFVPDVLNIGVAPDILVSHALANFRDEGGNILERHRLEAASVAPDAVKILMKCTSAGAVTGALGAGGTGIEGERDGDETRTITTRLLIDAMGAASPIAAQSRGAKKPDGVCITVGCCARADWPQKMATPDVMASTSPIDRRRSTQYFWEAFPVGRDPNARTMYMFSYGVCDQRRQTLVDTLEDFIEGVEKYQGISVEKMSSVKRVLFGFFPSYYRTCPTDVTFDRVLPVGDAGGLQSPISFGGFGCCMRHLSRITSAVDEALTGEGGNNDDKLLTKKWLQTLQWYLPSLSVTGLFHRAMSVEPGKATAGRLLDEYGINDILWSNMRAMEANGRETQLTFLRDVVTASGLSKTIFTMALRNPLLAVRMSAFVGIPELLIWTRHYVALVGYATALPVIKQLHDVAVTRGIVKGKKKFLLNRMLDAVKFGCGADSK